MTEGKTFLDVGVEKLYLSPEERTFKSRLGYDVELFDERGDFHPSVKIADDDSQVFTLYFSGFELLESDLKEHLKSYFLYLLPRYLPSSLNRYTNVISFFVSELNQGASPDIAIENTLIDNPGQNVAVMKSLVQFLILNEYEGVSFEKAEEVLKLQGYTSNRNGYLPLFTLDEELGPFTREELRVLNAALKNEEIHVADRLILALFIKFGLRPIQMSLLKESDFVEDAVLGLCYLNIPRVKQNNQYRRAEFSKRLIDDELASLIRLVLENNTEEYKDLKLDAPPLFYRKYIGYWGVKWYRLSHAELYTDVEKVSNAHHLSSRLFFHRLRSLTKFLPLSPRTGKPFHLTPYRFRYTVGTNAVVEGMAEEEVADLLDHSSTLCVKHYFRYTRDMWELLEDATSKRTEQKHFTAAWNREDDLSDNIYGLEVIELHAFTVIGKCQKEAACYLEPAVACYSCDKFCPNKEKASHRNALTSLRRRKEALICKAPATLSKQLDEAIAGCQAAIAYSEGAEIVNIHQGIGDE